MKKGASLISIGRDLQGKTRRAILFGIRGIGVAVVKVEVRRDDDDDCFYYYKK